MASVVAFTSSVAALAAFAAASPSSSVSEASTVRASVGLKSGAAFSGRPSSLSSRTVSNGSRVNCMQVWNPIGNPRFETLSYLPPLTSDQIAKEIDYMLAKNWIPCLEFDPSGSIGVMQGQPGYYDGRYWTMWKLPMFGCTDAASVLREVENCKQAYPGCFIRVLGFDNKRQVQCSSFIVHKPGQGQ